MVEETQVHGASVPEVAQRHGVNPNLLSIWRRLHRQGLLLEKGAPLGALLPVKVATPTVLPTERAMTSKVSKKSSGPQIEVEFASGHCLRIRGAVDRTLLRDLISALSSR
jgi:transposase-like protein